MFFTKSILNKVLRKDNSIKKLSVLEIINPIRNPLIPEEKPTIKFKNKIDFVIIFNFRTTFEFPLPLIVLKVK